MKKILTAISALAVAYSAAAQETYENARLLSDDLNGTARYVAMGGALDALGADISTIGTNPAGIGLFRHSTAQVSFGFVSQPGAKGFGGVDKTNMSFDQGGFVYSHRTGHKSFLNVAFNYRKSNNFNHILSAAGQLSGASQNKLSALKGAAGMLGFRYGDHGPEGTSNRFNSIDYLYYNTLLTPPLGDVATTGYVDATGYAFDRASSGYIGVYDLNISGNISDRVYLGLTVGIHDVNYDGYSEYSENLADGNALTVADGRIISGTGVDFKLGVIFRPVANSPFRIGFSVASPIWYDLTTRNFTELYTTYGTETSGYHTEAAYDFKLKTPWKFGISMGTTVGTNFAIGASYDFANYGKTDSRINDGSGYDWYTDSYYETSSSDKAMNAHTDATLKGVSTLKVGAEYRFANHWSVRAGYNYVSPMYNKFGYKDYTIDSPGTYYTSSTDYTNWKATNRATCGLGFAKGGFNVDLAYQYSATKGDFYPFSKFTVEDSDSPDNNVCQPADVDNKRHQLILTMGYTF